MMDFQRRLVLSNFSETIQALRDNRIRSMPKEYTEVAIVPEVISGGIERLEKQSSYKLNLKKKPDIPENRNIFAYDESIRSYSALEGNAYFTAHSLIHLEKEDYVNHNLISFYFISRAENYHKKNPAILYDEKYGPDEYSKLIYVTERNRLLAEYVPPRSILLIDGPIFGGQISSYNCELNKKLLSKDITPIFIVKNSKSCMIIENDPKLNVRYNNDMHWANEFLKEGERTSMFTYNDVNNTEFKKVFYYAKVYPRFPQRIEFHLNTYGKYKSILPKVFDLIYYFLIAQGSDKNPQVRPIAVAEMYARKSLEVIDINSLIQTFRITPTMNQQRFG